MEQNEKSLLDKVEELKKELENVQKEKSYGGSAIKVTDESKLADQYLNDMAKLALSRKFKNLVEIYNEKVKDNADGSSDYVREAAMCHYYVCQVRSDKVEEGVKAISESINELASMGALHGCLTPMSSLQLVSMPFKYDTRAVFCFVHVKPAFADVAKKVKHYTLEGGVGEALHDLDLDLPPGEFLAEVHLSHQLAMLHPVKSNEGRVFDMVQDFLRILPHGTEFIGYRHTAIVGLSMPYELRFRNPLLQKVKRVEIDYVREVALLNEGEKETLKQFKLTTGIRYFGYTPFSQGGNGKIQELYKRQDF